MGLDRTPEECGQPLRPENHVRIAHDDWNPRRRLTQCLWAVSLPGGSYGFRKRKQPNELVALAPQAVIVVAVEPVRIATDNRHTERDVAAIEVRG